MSMENARKVAVVTGASRGIGLEVCRLLVREGLRVVLTARDAEKGMQAVQALQRGLRIEEEAGDKQLVFHELDVRDPQSISRLASFIQIIYGGLDILVNNAAITSVIVDEAYVKENNIDIVDLLLQDQQTSKGFIIEYESAKACMEANYYGSKNVARALIPFLRSGARIVNVGSDFGKLHHVRTERLRQELADPNISEDFIDDMVESYLQDVKEGTWETKGWPLKYPSYKVSKIALHAFTRTLARELQADGREHFVNCAHPGYVKTDLTFGRGELTPEEGARNVVTVVLLPKENCPSGQFFYEGKLDTFE